MLIDPYRPRPLTYHGVADIEGWRMKVYGISTTAPYPRGALIEAALDCASTALPDDEGVGFLIAHDGDKGCNVLVDWWETALDLHQRYFRAALGFPASLEPVGSAAIGSVWELAVTGHEHAAWVRHVLATPEGPDIDAYLDDVLKR